MKDRFIHFLIHFPTDLVIQMELDVKRRKTRWWTRTRFRLLHRMNAL